MDYEVPDNFDEFDDIDIPNDGLSPEGKTEGVMRGDQAAELCVVDMQIATGILADGETKEETDVMMLDFKVHNGDIHRVLIPPAMAHTIAHEVADWFDGLHGEGKCGCGEHDDEPELNADFPQLDVVQSALKRIMEMEGGQDDGSIW